MALPWAVQRALSPETESGRATLRKLLLTNENRYWQGAWGQGHGELQAYVLKLDPVLSLPYPTLPFPALPCPNLAINLP